MRLSPWVFVTVVVCLTVLGLGLWNEHAKADEKLQEKLAEMEKQNGQVKVGG